MRPLHRKGQAVNAALAQNRGDDGNKVRMRGDGGVVAFCPAVAGFF